jgi:hypothetical protein
MGARARSDAPTMPWSAGMRIGSRPVDTCMTSSSASASYSHTVAPSASSSFLGRLDHLQQQALELDGRRELARQIEISSAASPASTAPCVPDPERRLCCKVPLGVIRPRIPVAVHALSYGKRRRG